jgi:sialate O-acetylesterase
MQKTLILVAMLSQFTLTQTANAELRLSKIFGDHMVLQRDETVRIWGWANKGTSITLSFADQEVERTVDASGQWTISLSPLEASVEGRELTVTADSEIVTFRDVVVGDVWHASGQSNMAMNMASAAERLPQAKNDLLDADLKSIRFRRLNEGHAAKPQDALSQIGGWTISSPETARGYSAAAFYFARSLYTELKVPIGIIDSSRGGTPIEPFIPRNAFASHATLRKELKLAEAGDLRGIWKLPGGVRARDENWLPGRLFNSRLAPVRKFAVRGLIWYQGESNSGVAEDPRDYRHKMHALITGWRDELRAPLLPVYFVQLPGGGAGPGWPYLREQQRLSAGLPKTGMVVTIDLLDTDIHPANKIDVGKRLATWAMATEYGKATVPSGPMFQKADFAKYHATVHFSYSECGLMIANKVSIDPPVETPDAALQHFELADASGKWHSATAEVAGTTVVVRSETVGDPVAVRYAYSINPQHCRLYNRVGLPASPFCSNLKLIDYDPGLPAD